MTSQMARSRWPIYWWCRSSSATGSSRPWRRCSWISATTRHSSCRPWCRLCRRSVSLSGWRTSLLGERRSRRRSQSIDGFGVGFAERPWLPSQTRASGCGVQLTSSALSLRRLELQVPREPSGLEAMRERIARASRTPPRPRKARAAQPEEALAQPPEAPDTPAPAAPRRPPRRSAPRNVVLRVPADAPAANLAIRVRRPLDERLAELIHGLRQQGIRTSKVELIEMLLWELPAAPSRDLRGRIGAFRSAAPRGAGAPLEEGS